MFEFDNSYYEDEVREDFYIPGMVKRSWAAQMSILNKVSDICKKYGIRWFADCGTLIGAVRHHGFIPWDDDLDVCMLKKDYDCFIEVAERELPNDYRILNIYNDMNHKNFVTRIINHDYIDTGRNYLANNHGFPYSAGIDIFPLHYLYNDPKKEDERQAKANYIWMRLNELLAKGAQSQGDIDNFFDECEKTFRIGIERNMPVDNAVYWLLDSVYSMTEAEDAEFVALIPFWIKDKSHRFPISIFDNTVEIAFETGTIQVTAGYEELLRLEYGNWERASRNGGMHNYPYYTEQEKKLEANSNKRLPYRYYYNKNDIANKNNEKDDLNLTLIKSMKAAHLLIRKMNDLSICFDLLCKCQELAINFGNNIEKDYGNDAEALVHLLENYCEHIYEMTKTEYNEIEFLEKDLECIKKEYDKIRGNGIIFLLSKIQEFVKLKKHIEYFIENKEIKVFLMPIPYYEKDWYGELSEEKYEFENIKELLKADHFKDIDLLDYRNYDFLKTKYEICVVDPFDEYREAISVHPFFYTSNLRKICKKLSYIDIIQDVIPEVTDERGCRNAQKYIISPGVLRSGIVYLPNDKVRDFYLKTLSENDISIRQDVWKDKFIVMDKTRHNEMIKSNGKKCILFYTSISVFYIYKESAIDKLKNVINTFYENRDDIFVRWVTDMKFEDDFKRLISGLWDNYLDIKEFFYGKNIGEIINSDDDSAIDDCDAFYGSAGYLMNLSRNKGLPVMVWNIEV